MEEAAQNVEPVPEASSDFDGTYKLWGEIKTGSRSVVYHAEQHKLGKEVAIKVLRERVVEDPLLREAFNEELRALCALDHPNLVGISGFGIVGDAPYIAMELLEGDTLAEAMAKGPIETKLAEQLILEMLRALAHMHVRGVVHRNLTPSAVFLQRDGDGVKLKLIDYGLTSRPASHTAGDTPRALALAYLPPEQAAGEDVDARADVYSAAAIIMEMMTGDLMHVAGAERTSSEMLQAPQVVATATPPFHAFISRALDPAKVERFRNADQMLRALLQLPTPWFERTSVQLEDEEAASIDDVRQDGTSEFPLIAEPEPYESPVPPALPARRRAKTSRKLMAAGALVALVAGGVKLAEHLQPPPNYEDARLTNLSGDAARVAEATPQVASAAASPLANAALAAERAGRAQNAGPLRAVEGATDEGPWADPPAEALTAEEHGLGPFERAYAGAARGSLTEVARGQALAPRAEAQRGAPLAAAGANDGQLAAAGQVRLPVDGALSERQGSTTALARSANEAAPFDATGRPTNEAASDGPLGPELARGANADGNATAPSAADDPFPSGPQPAAATLTAADASRGFGARTAVEHAPVSPQLAAAELLQRISKQGETNPARSAGDGTRGQPVWPAYPAPLARDPGNGPAVQPPLAAATDPDLGGAQRVQTPLIEEPSANAQEPQPSAAGAPPAVEAPRAKLKANADGWPPPRDYVPPKRDWPPPKGQQPAKRQNTDWPPPREDVIAASPDAAPPPPSAKVNGAVRHVPPSPYDIRELLKLAHRREPPRGKPSDPWAGLLPVELESLREAIAKGEPGTAQQVLALRNFCRANPRVTHGHLLLAGLYKNRGWNVDALDQYELAYRKDPTARGAPEMLADTLQMVIDGVAHEDAARFIVRSYQREALPALDYALRDKGLPPEASARLKQLRARVASSAR